MTRKYNISLKLLLVITLFLAFMFQNCQKNDEIILKKKIFIKILSELMVIEKLNVTPEEKAALTKEVFANNKTTQEIYLATKEHYKNDAEFWMRAYKEAGELIKQKEKELKHPDQPHS